MRKGYLIFTTHDGDELDATFIDDKDFFDKLISDEVKDNEKAFDLWVEYKGEHKDLNNDFYTQAPGNEDWPFNDVTILGTYYILVY